VDKLIAFHRAMRGTVPTVDALRATAEWYRDTYANDADGTALALDWLEALDDVEADTLGWQGAQTDSDSTLAARGPRSENGHVPVWQTFGHSAHEGYEILAGAPVGAPETLSARRALVRDVVAAARWKLHNDRVDNGTHLTRNQRRAMRRKKGTP
jgi:hypothetical protein